MSATARRPKAEPTPGETLPRDTSETLGREARGRASLDSHGSWQPAADRPDPVEVLEAQGKSRVAELVPLRYGRMLASPFTFYRGAAAIMGADLGAAPDTGLTAQLCGDAHLANFGALASPERRLMFDINDLDETLPGPWEWDVKRLLASIAVAGRSNGLSAAERKKALLVAAASYRTAMAAMADMGTLEVWYSSLSIDQVMSDVRERVARDTGMKKAKPKGKGKGKGKKAGKEAARLAVAEKNAAKARTKDHEATFRKLTRVVDGRLRIVSEPPLIVPVDELMTELGQAEDIKQLVAQFMVDYAATLSADRHHLFQQYRFVDLARKVVGVGSVGTRAWIALFLGVNRKPLFLQVKEAQASVLEPYAGKSEYSQHGERVVMGQRLMQAYGDIFLGWHRTNGIDGIKRDYYVRQLKDWKGSALVDDMDVVALTIYAEICARTLARAHARSGDRIAIATYLGEDDTFDKAMAEYSEAYADQNERDYKTLLKAVKAGRIDAVTGV
jgi:uncharacterized protein (DUF2252 family)